MVESWISRNTPRGKGQWVRPIPDDCDLQHVNWKLFLDGRPEPKFDANKYINWRLFWEFSGGNVTENMVHQNAWITVRPGPRTAHRRGHDRRRFLRAGWPRRSPTPSMSRSNIPA